MTRIMLVSPYIIAVLAVCSMRVASSQATVIPGASYYVSPTGQPSANGSASQPWTFAAALAKTAIIKPGDTIYLRSGVYKAPFPTPFRLQFADASTEPIVIRSYPGERAIIDGNLEVLGPGITLRDLEITSSVARRQVPYDVAAPTDLNTNPGVNVLAPHVKVINCIIHDLGGGIGMWSSARDTEVYGNIIYYNGWDAADRPHGHGVYAQNETGLKIIEDNIIHGNFGHGIQVYGSRAASLKNFRLTGNIVFENGSLTGKYSRNILIGGGNLASNLEIRNNYLYYMLFGDNINLGHYPDGAGCADASFVENYIAGGTVSLHNCQFTKMSGNIITGELRPGPASLYPANTYGPQTNLSVYVRPNRFEAGRGNVAIFNPTGLPTVAVDLTALNLRSGDKIEVRNAQDYFADVTTITFNGSPVDLRMTGRPVAMPVGWKKPPSAFPKFGAFVVQRVSSNPERPVWSVILITGMLLTAVVLLGRWRRVW